MHICICTVIPDEKLQKNYQNFSLKKNSVTRSGDVHRMNGSGVRVRVRRSVRMVSPSLYANHESIFDGRPA